MNESARKNKNKKNKQANGRGRSLSEQGTCKCKQTEATKGITITKNPTKSSTQIINQNQ